MNSLRFFLKDDVMRSDRITEQYTVARAHPDAVGVSLLVNEIDKGVPHFSDCWELLLKRAEKVD